MKTVKEQIINILKTIQGGSAFCSFGSTAQILPGMYIKDYGEVSFPFSTSTYQKLLEFSKQAPYGRGEQTITDTSVRRTQEIDASNISFKNPLWEKTLLNILAKVKADLAIDSKTIQASLYKLLIYKEGDFFLPHKDSEKEKGMFGALVIALPSKHKGGELVINFDGQSKNISFSEIIENYQMPYAAFYADCEHEIKKVDEGYRLCLVYNLIQTDNSLNIKSPAYSKEVEALSSALMNTDLKKSDTPNVILLNHQYTPKNFGLNFLKRNDAPQAKAIIEAADKAGYYAKLALLTCYQMGDMEADYDFHDYGYGSSYDTEDIALCEMGDVHEEEILVEHWAEDSLPDLGRFEVDPQNIISQFTLKEDEPIQKEGEGYTGNAGMTMEYWYHYAAVVIWPKVQNTNILKDSSVEVKLKWLSYFVQFSDKTYDIKAILKALCNDSFNIDNYWYNVIDFSPIPLAFNALDDVDFTAQAHNQSFLVKVFPGVQPKVWVDFFSKYPELLNTTLTKVAEVNKLKKTLHISLVLKELSQSEPLLFEQKGMAELIKMPEHQHSDQMYKSASRTDIRNLVSNLVYLSSYYEHEHWFTDLLRSITEHELANRDYVNKVLIYVLLKLENVNNKFAIKLADFCLKDLKLRIANKPTPPENWSRQVPQSLRHKKQWSILKDFIESPVQQVFDYAIRQAEREIMENAIDSVVIDLKYVTIKKGSPHTLRITKTQNAFEKKLKEWHQDLELLHQLKIKFSHII